MEGKKRSCDLSRRRGDGAEVGRITVINFVIFLISFVGTLGGAGADRTFTKVYEPIKGTAACFKRLNGTDEIGCRSSSRGEVGVLHIIEDQASLQWVMKDGPHSPYIVITYPDYFNRENLMKFRDSGRVNGVLLLPPLINSTSGQVEGEGSLINRLIKSTTAPKQFSTDSTCPNNQFGFYNKSSPQFCQKWNENGSGLLFENFDFPIFFVKNETEAETLRKCYDTFNRPVNGTAQDWPLCAGQLKSFMMAARDTPTCLRRSSVFSINPGTAKVCDPLGDQNLWATLLPPMNTTANNTSAIVVATRFDGASLFDEMSPSADTSVTGLVTLLTVIKQLASVRDQLSVSSSSLANSVYFMIFNGESFGYIGSSRIAYDMTQGKFPLKLEEIDYFLEINQAALHAPGDSYFVHQTDLGTSKEFTDILQDSARSQNIPLKVLGKQPPSTSTLSGVPPSSLQSFLRERPDLTGLVLTNHRDSYTNPYYNSIFDTKESLNFKYGDQTVKSLQQKLASLSATISNSVIRLLMQGSDIPTVTPDLETVDELLHCYLETSNCSIFRSIAGIEPPTNSLVEPYPMYVGVSAYTNTLTQITKYIMISYLGTPVENVTDENTCFGRNDPDSPEASRPRYFLNKTCYDCPEVNMTEAKSPAFIIPDYDWASGKYSTWTESVWQKFSVRIFLKPSLVHEIMTLISGILVVIVSMFAVRFVNQKAEMIFPSRTDAMVC